MQMIDNMVQQGRDRYMLLSTEELPALVEKHSAYLRPRISGGWHGDKFDVFARKVVLGDEELVAASEEHLHLIEDQVPVSRGWRNVDDVVGAVPNVPAYLAGHPQCMRRRERTMKESAPLTIFMDLTSSGGINTAAVTKRGTVLLALTRMLVDHRSVELWVGAALGGGSKVASATVAWRVDTAPLDLARAAYHISAVAMSRGFGYGLCHAELGSSGQWPLCNYDEHVATAPQRLQAVFPGTEVLYVPPIYLHDKMVTDPVGWIKRTLAKYTGGNDEE